MQLRIEIDIKIRMLVLNKYIQNFQQNMLGNQQNLNKFKKKNIMKK